MATASGFPLGLSGSRSGPSVTQPPSGIPGQAQPMVVVWEWQDDFGYWRPYSGQVSCYIEQCLLHQRGSRGGGPASTSISLGQSDPSLAAYIIDIPNLKQFRQDTGKLRCVRQSLFPQSSALSSGVFWEWANDEGSWTAYEIRTSILLEHSYQAGQGTADLGPHGYNYIVDLTALAQVNKTSGFRRQVRRQASAPYPLATSSVIHSGPACTCQQCLSHSSTTGPMPSRSRHSFSAGQASSRPSFQGHGRAAAGGGGGGSSSGAGGGGSSSSSSSSMPSSVYSPYPRRPLSVGNVSWGGPWSSASSTSQHPGPPLGPPGHLGPGLGHGPGPGPGPGFGPGLGLGLGPGLGPGLPYPPSTNGFSIPTIPVHLNGSTSVSAALAGGPQKAEDVIQRYMEEVAPPADEDCIICMERLTSPSGYDGAPEGGHQAIQPSAVGKLTKCGHTLHMLCMLAMYNNGNKDGSIQCPSCKTIYGQKTGTQPKGKMEIYSVSQALPGHSDCGTIQIVYNILPGIQGPEHPNPGQPYSCRGFPRFCFLPDNEKGRKVLELLKIAWTRRLIFTVGTSSTTGEPDTVVWNEIHHKTEMMSNVSGHGYPDPNYLDNVLAELASQGVTEDCLKQDRRNQGTAPSPAH